MTSTASTQPDTVGTPPDAGTPEYTQHDLVLAQIRARRASAVAYLVLAIAVLAAVSVAGISAYKATDSAADNGARVDNLVNEAIKLRDQVNDLQGQIDSRRETTDALEQCEQVLLASVRDTTRDYNAAEGDLIITLRPLAAGTPGQAEIIDAAITKLSKALDAYRTATIQSSTWNVLPRTVKEATPCPLPLPE